MIVNHNDSYSGKEVEYKVKVFQRGIYKWSENFEKTSNGFTTRSELNSENCVFHTTFIPRIDTLDLSKYFHSGNTLTLEFTWSPLHFASLATDNRNSDKVTLLDVVLEVRQFLPPKPIEITEKVKWLTFSFNDYTPHPLHKRFICWGLWWIR